jgi:site-specific recombinase XerC
MSSSNAQNHVAWNKGRLLGQKPPLKPKEIWSLRIRLQLAGKRRDLALFNLAIDSKLRGCDLVSLRVRDVYQGTLVASRAIVMQRKTQRPVQFEITEATREAVAAWVANRDLRSGDFLFPGREEGSHLSVRQYSRIVKGWAGVHWTRPMQVRHALAAADEGYVDLQAYEEHSRDPTVAWPHEARKHRSLSRDRGG